MWLSSVGTVALGSPSTLSGWASIGRGGVGPVRVAEVGGDRRVAVLEAERLRVRVGVGVVLRVELAEEVLRLEPLRIGRREVREQARLRRGQREPDGLRVDRLHLHALARHQHVITRLGAHVGVECEVVVPEDHVVRGERRAVGPLVALAQGEGEHGEVVVPLPALRDVGHDGREVVGHAHQVHVAHRQEVRRARLGRVRQHVQHPAVAADPVVGRHDQRLFGEALGHRRKFRVAGDAPVHLGDCRILLEGELAAGELLELGQLVLLGVLPGRDAHHVGDGDRRAVRRQGVAGQQGQARSNAEKALVHGDCSVMFAVAP